MIELYNKFKIILIIQILCFAGTIGWSQNLSLKVAGNDEQGFNVDIYNNNQILVKNTEEFSLRIANLDLSEIIELPAWRGSQWSGDKNRLQLKTESYVTELDLNLTISVTYEVINQNVIEKRIDLFQSGIPSLYYTIEETAKPAETPSKYVTFEHGNFPGGFAHEMFPSVGFVTPENQVVGFLMDAGYKNHYTRTTRRRFNGHGGGFVGMRKLPDPALISAATLADRENGQHYIKQTFGEMYNLDAGTELALQIDDSYKEVGNVEIQKQSGLITLNCNPSDRSGIELLTPLKDQKVYTISFLSKGNTPVAFKLFRLKNGEKTIELEHGIKYIDHFPIDENEWTLFKGSILVPYIENDSISMFIGSLSGKKSWLKIKDLRIVEHLPQKQPYNIIPMGDTVSKTTYVFVEPWTNHHDYVISSQSRLAEGKGFDGTLIEKMMYANLNMLL
jgi:hypothetical protein